MTYRINAALKARALAVLAAGACALGIASATASTANAAIYWNGSVPSLDRKPSGSAYNLRTSIAWSDGIDHLANAGAHYPGGTSLYANWAEAWGFACHPYAAGQTLGAMLRNPHSKTLGMVGDVNFSVNEC